MELIDTTPALAEAADGVNRAIAEAPDRHPQVEVADWSAHVADLDGFDAMRNPDGVHYRPEGSRIRHDWVVGLLS